MRLTTISCIVMFSLSAPAFAGHVPTRSEYQQAQAFKKNLIAMNRALAVSRENKDLGYFHIHFSRRIMPLEDQGMKLAMANDLYRPCADAAWALERVGNMQHSLFWGHGTGYDVDDIVGDYNKKATACLGVVDRRPI